MDEISEPGSLTHETVRAAPGCDLNCLFAKYEALQNAGTKTEVQLVLIDSEAEGNATEVQALQKRIANLAMHAKGVREAIEEMGKDIKSQETVAAK